MTSIFIDRDGVINERIPNDYVKSWEEFVFRPEAIEALVLLSQQYDYVFIITNQQGVGKGLMSLTQLEEIHNQMLKNIVRAGGRIHAIYCCTQLSVTGPFCRKPLPGMAYQAQRDFPLIDFRQSTMVGDMHTDIRFGNHLGMRTVRIRSNENAPTKLRHIQAMDSYEHLIELATTL